MSTKVMHSRMDEAQQNSGEQAAQTVARTEFIDEPSLVGMTLLGRYHILSKIGEGGMGIVYLAEHTAIRKKFAIKVLGRDFVRKPDLVERFLQEARAASMIAQENVVEITDFGDAPHGSVFFVMEYLQGEDLARTIKTQGRLDWPRVKSIMLQICRALQAAHEVGIIHRDMKPENCFRISRRQSADFIKVLDFGIAKVVGEDSDTSRGLTRTGMIFGTPEYMSPEQAQGQKPDHRVDVYAAGIIMFEMLTGRVPFLGDTFMGILTKHMFEAAPWPSTVAPDAKIPADVESVVLKALEKDPDSRFAGMEEMAEAIHAAGVEAPVKSPRPIRAPIATGGGYPTVQKSTMQTAALNPVTPSEGSIVSGPSLLRLSPKMWAAAGVLGLCMFGVVLWASSSLDGGMGNSGIVVSDASISNVAGGSMADSGSNLKDSGAVTAIGGINRNNAEAEKKNHGLAAGDIAEVQQEIVDNENEIQPTELTRIHIKTPIEARVFDLEKEVDLGKTNSADGLELEKRETPIQLELRAKGYKPLQVLIPLDQDGTHKFPLKKEVKSKGKSRRIKKRSPKDPIVEPKPKDVQLSELKPPSGPDKPRPSNTGTSQPKKTKGKNENKKLPKVNSPDLINPFGPK